MQNRENNFQPAAARLFDCRNRRRSPNIANTRKDQKDVSMEPWFFALFAAVLILFGIIGLVLAAKRRKALLEWANSHGWKFDPDRDRDFPDRFPEFKHFQQGSDRYAYNIVRGELHGLPITAFDFHYETHSRNSKGRRSTTHHRSSAAIVESNLPLKPLFIRHEGFFDKITEFFGHDDIDFESAEFSRKFYVKAADRRWAYDVLHARTMQFLLDMPRFTIQFDRGHVVAYRNSTLNIKDFEAAVEVVSGILDQLPDYLVRQQKGAG